MTNEFIPRRRIQVLDTLAEHGEMTADKINGHINMRLNTLRRLMLFYHRQGLVKREKYGREYYYKLSDQGWARQQWYKRHPVGGKDEGKVVEGEG